MNSTTVLPAAALAPAVLVPSVAHIIASPAEQGRPRHAGPGLLLPSTHYRVPSRTGAPARDRNLPPNGGFGPPSQQSHSRTIFTTSRDFD